MIGTCKLHVLYGEVPEPIMDVETGLYLTDVLTGMPIVGPDKRVEVAVVDYEKQPTDLDWVPPFNPPWGKRGGTYSYLWEELV